MHSSWTRIFGGLPEEELLQVAFRFAMSLCRNQHDAEDLVQEACVKLCNRYGRIKNQKLMFTAIRNLFYDTCKREKIVKIQSIEESSEIGMSAELLDDLSNVDLDAALHCLNASEREVIYLNRIEGYSVTEIAKLTTQARGTVLWRLGQAMGKLKKFCEEEMNNVNSNISRDQRG